MYKRSFSILLIIVFLLSVMSGCGGNDVKTSETNATTTNVTTINATTTEATTTEAAMEEEKADSENPGSEVIKDPDADDTTPAFIYEKRINKTENHKFIVNLPDGYDEDENKDWPLIVYLHGGGPNTNSDSYFRDLLRYRKLPAILLAPMMMSAEDQGVSNMHTTFDKLVLGEIVKTVSAEYRVDTSKRVIIGYSGGASNTWDMLYYHPDMFSKAVIMAGLATAWKVYSLPKDLQIWVFSGDKDRFYPYQKSAVEAAKQFGADVVYTVFLDTGHSITGKAFKMKGMPEWLTSDEDLRTDDPTKTD